MKKSKLNNFRFRIIDGLAKKVYLLREFHLVRLNMWLDELAGKYWTDKS